MERIQSRKQVTVGGDNIKMDLTETGCKDGCNIYEHYIQHLGACCTSAPKTASFQLLASKPCI
jgi:hypothetical protein